MGSMMSTAKESACFEAIIEAYFRYRSANPDKHIDCSLAQSQLADAITVAAQAVDEHGKIHSHQRRLGRARLVRWAEKLTKHERSIGASTSFDALHTTVKRAAQNFAEGGIGELAIYDTAHRIGAKMNLLPDKVYLHSGTRTGAEILFDDVEGMPFLEISRFPKPFQKLDATEIEDILCMYKDEIKSCLEGKPPFPPSSNRNSKC